MQDLYPKLKNYVVVDVETTGLNPIVNEILSIALVPVLKPEAARVWYICQDLGTVWDREAAEMFQKWKPLYEKEVKSKQSVIEEIKAWIKETGFEEKIVLVGHNVGFDISFMKRLPSIEGIGHRSIDTHTLLQLAWFCNLIELEDCKSDKAFKKFEIEVAEEDRHTALGDARATRQLFMLLLDKLVHKTPGIF